MLEYLRVIGLSELEGKFREEKVTGEDLEALTESELKEDLEITR